MPLPIIPLVFDFLRNVWALLKDRETRGVVYLVIFVLISGMIFYHTAEGWTWLDSLYFSVTTLTTVGLGDLYPKTDAGKAFTIVYILVGLGILAGFLTMMAQNTARTGSAASGSARQSQEYRHTNNTGGSKRLDLKAVFQPRNCP